MDKPVTPERLDELIEWIDKAYALFEGEIDSTVSAALRELRELRARTEANVVQIMRCASGKHQLSMLIDDCAYCKIEAMRPYLQHYKECNVNEWPHFQACSCGLVALLSSKD